jgi:hypothetical protein
VLSSARSAVAAVKCGPDALVVVFWANKKAPLAIVLPPSIIRMLTSDGFEDPKARLIMTGDFVSLRNGEQPFSNDETMIGLHRVEPVRGQYFILLLF